MSRNLLNKYIWLLETIERHGRLSRAEPAGKTTACNCPKTIFVGKNALY